MMAGWDISPAGWIWMAIWIAALLVMVWLIVGRGRDRDVAEDPHEILRVRLARGEITPEEYERARVLLALDRAPSSRSQP